MDLDVFWQLIDDARADAGDPFDIKAIAAALTGRLAGLPETDILDFGEQFYDLRGHRVSWEICSACYLVSGYMSDDYVTYFKAGVIALGRRAYEQFTGDPDSLADDPVVLAMASGQLGRDSLNGDDLGGAAIDAYARVTDGDDDAYWDAVAVRAQPPDPANPVVADGGDPWGDPGDAELLPVRLPRLSALFPGRVRDFARALGR